MLSKRTIDRIVYAICLTGLLLLVGRQAAWPQMLVVEITTVDSSDIPAKQITVKDAAEALAILRQQQKELWMSGYLASGIDTIAETDSIWHVSRYQGPKYDWVKLKFNGFPPALLTTVGIRSSNWEQVPLDPVRFAHLNEQILTYCEQNGYPFAATHLDSVVMQSNGISAQLVLDRGRLIRIDTIIVNSTVSIAPAFMQNYLDIHPGDLYQEEKLTEISKRLDALPFLEQSQPWRFDFTIARNQLHLFLKEKKANQINGLIGLQPNTEALGKFLLTADFNLALQNSLGYGESIQASFQNLQYKSPRFHIAAIAPYLFGSLFGLEGSFDLYKKDTTYRRTTFEGGIRYQFSALDYLKLAYQHTNARLISPDTQSVRRQKKLPDDLDLNSQGVALTMALDKTDYTRNPQKGWQTLVEATALQRQIVPNAAITEIDDGSGFDYQTLYDEANQDKYQYRFTGTLSVFIPLYRQIIARIGYQGGYISGRHLFRNELFLIGGFGSLRGFDEESIAANHYQIGTLEMRLLLSRNSYLYLFTDMAYTQTRFSDFDRSDNPVSIGAGVTLDNKSGVFRIAIGVGKHRGDHFQLRQAKIHFGYVAYF